MALLLLIAHVWFAQFSHRLTFEADFFTISALLLLASPYFNAGMAISAILAGAGGKVHTLYGYNLLGSAIGCTTIFLCLGVWTAPELLVVCATVLALLAVCLHRRRVLPGIVVLVVAPVLFFNADRLFPYQVDPSGQLAIVRDNLARVEDNNERVARAL